MKEKVIIKKYAAALVEVIPAADYKNTYEDLKLLITVFKENSKLIDLLQAHLINKSQKEEIITILTKNVQQKKIWKSFFLLLINNHRLPYIIPILQYSQEYILNKQNKKLVTLTLSGETDKETIDHILDHLKKLLKVEVIANISYDKSLIGGFKAETENIIVDGSIKHNLLRFIRDNSINN